MFDRRAFMKWMGAAPLLGYIAGQEAWNKAWATAGKDNIYSRIGVRPFINARGTWTYLSGSLELPEVRAAKAQAALHFVDVIELQRAVGRRLAELSGAESGMITSGAAGAMAAATAACIAGTDPAEDLAASGYDGSQARGHHGWRRSAFDSAIRLVGGKLVLTHGHEELEKALSTTRQP